jgi:hypothetical protein
VSLNQWIAVAVAENIGVVETAAELFRWRVGQAMGNRLIRFPRNSPRVAPEPEDEIGPPARATWHLFSDSYPCRLPLTTCHRL